jgi:hypothetical protein
MAGKAGWPSCKHQTVIAIQPQSILQEIIDLAGESAVTAKDSRRAACLGIEWQLA